VYERLIIQRMEVAAFIRREMWKVPADPVVPFTEHFSVVLSQFDRHGRGLGANASQWLDQSDLSFVAHQKKLTPASLTLLQGADKKKLKAIEPEVFRIMMIAIVPDLDPHGKAHTKAQKAAMADFCLAHKESLLGQCPAVAVEDKLYDVRIGDPGRKPMDSDAVDLQHAVVALSYCDLFLVDDKYVRECAARLAKVWRAPMAKVLKSVDQIPRS
jgi:hypothetical protein